VQNLLKRIQKPMSLLGVGGLAGMTALGIVRAQPAQAANVSGQAIDSSSILPPTFTPPAAPFIGNANVGDTFEINLSNVLASPTNANDFNLNNIFSLQFANLNTGNGLPTVNLSDLQLQVTGTFTGGGPFNTFTPIAIWDTSIGGQPNGEAFKGTQTSQGATNYSASGTQFGPTGAFNTLAISLTPSNTFGTFGNAGVINTSPINLATAGVQTLTGLKITGKIAGYTGQGALSAGLAIYTGAPSSPPTYQVGNAPNVIYGNALTYGVPGPLPIFGAGAAFGMSRKLRRRIGASKTVA